MVSLWFWIACLEVLKLYNMSVSVKYMAIILLLHFIISVPGAHLLMAIGLKYKGHDFEGKKTKFIIAGSMLWIFISIGIINYYLTDILNVIKSFV